MIKALAHVCLLSSDLERTLDFYVETLGLRRQFDFLRNGALHGFYLAIGDHQFIEVFRTGSEPLAEGRRPITHLCLEVEDIDALRTRLLAADVACTEKKLGADASWQCWCQDPDGVDIEFHQYTPESSQLTGRECVVNW